MDRMPGQPIADFDKFLSELEHSYKPPSQEELERAVNELREKVEPLIAQEQDQEQAERDFLDALGGEEEEEQVQEPAQPADANPEFWREAVVEENGAVRQAGADHEGQFLKALRIACERQLYLFARCVMGRKYLTKKLHMAFCRDLQRCPPYRKMRLMPRDHAKTSVVSHCLPPHIIIQPAASNIYFPGLAGSECRIMLAGETERRAKNNLRVVATAFEGNRLLRAMWPSLCWEKPKAQAPLWNDSAIIVPRVNEYPDPTLFAIGVGGAITGARPNVQIKDDLISIEAANSDLVMQSAIDWHLVSRALLDEYEHDTGLVSLEFMIGTRWAVWDLYSHTIENDPTVDCKVRAIVEDGEPIWPERFTLDKVEELRKSFGAMFYLLYMNSVNNPELTDFDVGLLRYFKMLAEAGGIEFEETEQDYALVMRMERNDGQAPEPPTPTGQHLTAENFNAVFGLRGRDEFLARRYGEQSPAGRVRMRAS